MTEEGAPLKIIGITGPTGAGKTTALNVLRDLGAEVLDADAVYHRLLEESLPLRQSLAAAFGSDILDGEGNPWCLEVNSLPGMTANSLVPKEARAIGMTYNQLCEEIVQQSYRLKRRG